MLIYHGLKAIYYNDMLLLKRMPKEDCINHRLAFYFETFFGDIIHDDMYYSVDLEYDKNINESSKEIQDYDNNTISIRPDIIIHKREDNQNNLLAVEAKYNRLNLKDFTKLRKLLRPPYNYSNKRFENI